MPRSVFVGVMTGQMWLAIPFLVLAGSVESLHLMTTQTVVQLLAPNHLRGRLTSGLQLWSIASPIGQLITGAMADRFGVPVVGIGISLAALLLTAAIFVRSERMRNLRLSELQQLGQEGLRDESFAGGNRLSGDRTLAVEPARSGEEH